MTLKDAIASCLVIALGIILVAHFALFWIYGGVFIYESNKVVLSIETVMSVAIFGFGVERLLNSANAKSRREVIRVTQRFGEDATRAITSPNGPQLRDDVAVSTATKATAMSGVTAVLAESFSDSAETCVLDISDNILNHREILHEDLDIYNERTADSLIH